METELLKRIWAEKAIFVSVLNFTSLFVIFQAVFSQKIFGASCFFSIHTYYLHETDF